MADQILLLWCGVGLLAYGAFTLSVVFRGIKEDEAPLELKVAHITGKILLGIASVALLLVVSKGLNELIGWVLR